MKTLKGWTLIGASILAVTAIAVSGFGVKTVYATPPPPECPTGSTCTIDAKAIDDHEVDDTEWHFVITDIDDNAPATITVTWSNGTTSILDLDKVTGGVAHYATTDHLDDGVLVTGASTDILGEWDGQFNLSHGPEGGEECEGDDCDEDDDECPAGTTGTPPNCVPIVNECPAGTTGTYPDCTPIENECPAGTTGTPPNCDPVEEDYCAPGQGHSQEVACKDTKKEREHDCGQLQDPNERRKTSTWEWATRHFGRNGGPRCTSREFPGGWRMGDGHRGWFNLQWKRADR